MSKGFGNLLRQAKMMKKKMEQTQEEIKSRVYEGSAGQGKVMVTVNGDYRLESIFIDKRIIDPEQSETLEDLVTVAINNAVGQARDDYAKEMGSVTGGLGMEIPGLF